MNGAIATIALFFFLTAELRQPSAQRLDWRLPAFAASAFVIVASWMLIQAILEVPATFRHPLWAMLDDVPLSGTISVNPSATWVTIAQIVPIGLLAIVAMRLAVDRRRATFLLKLVIATTVAIAVYGLVATHLDIRQVFLLEDDAYVGFLTGTFVGRNAAATYFVIGISVTTALIASRLETIIDHPRRTSGAPARLSKAARRCGTLLVADLILVVALLNTGSRGGLIAGAIALLVITFLTLRRASQERPTHAAMFAAVLGALLIVAAISSDALLGRLEAGVDSGERLAVYRDTAVMIADRPFLGHGAGTFADAYPIYHQLAPSQAIWNRAHNTYLQTIAELGFPAFAILVATVLAVTLMMARSVTNTSIPRPVSVATLAAIAAAAFHAAVDFSVQIQAVGLTLLILLGAGVGEALSADSHAAAAHGDDDPDAGRPSFEEREVVDVVIPVVRRPPAAQHA